MEQATRAAIITGGSRGVGRATALALAERGYAVAVNYSQSSQQAQSVVDTIVEQGGRALAIQGDVADDHACRALVEQAQKAFGHLDALVNNAGTTTFIPHEELDAVQDDDWDRLMGVNVKGPFQMTRAALPALKEAGGAVVNVASIAGVSGMGSSIPYCASKAAVINMTMALARVCAPEVRVNAVAPGFIEGEWLRKGLGDQYDAVKGRCEEKAPLHKVSQPEDIAAAILSFIEGSTMITGQTVVVDGGMLLGGGL